MEIRMGIIDKRFDKYIDPYIYVEDYSAIFKITFNDNNRHDIQIPFSKDLLEDKIILSEHLKLKLYEFLDSMGDISKELSNEQKKHVSNTIKKYTDRIKVNN